MSAENLATYEPADLSVTITDCGDARCTTNTDDANDLLAREVAANYPGAKRVGAWRHSHDHSMGNHIVTSTYLVPKCAEVQALVITPPRPRIA